MGKRRKSTKKSSSTDHPTTTDSSENILLQSTDKLTSPFVAIHQNNLLPSSDSSPDINEQTQEENSSNHHHNHQHNHHNQVHESKLLDTINKVDPNYAPHHHSRQQHLHHHQQQHHESSHHHHHQVDNDDDFINHSSQMDPHHHHVPYYVNDDDIIEDDEEEDESAKLYNKDGEETTIEAIDITKRYERKQSLKQRLKNFSIRDLIVKWRYSILYSLYLIFMSGLAAFLFGWSIYKRGKIEEIWFLALEGLCTFAICYECVLSIFLYKRQFYKKLIVWCNIFVSLSALVIFSLLLYCFIEKEENYFWNNVAFAQEAVIGLHCCVNAFRIIVYILQIRRGGGMVRDNFIVLDVSNNENNTTSRSPSTVHLEEPSEQHRYGTAQV